MQAFLGVVLGLRGAGKSRMTFDTLVPLCPAPVFVLDTLGGDIGYGVHYSDLHAMALDVVHGDNHSGVYVFNSSSDIHSDAFFNVVEKIAEDGRGPITLVLDEIDKFCSSHSVNDALDRMVRYGRRYGINILAASRRTGEINKGIRSQADFFISFKQVEPGDVKAIAERSKTGAARVNELDLWRNTGTHSQFIVVGELPGRFDSIKENSSFIET